MAKYEDELLKKLTKAMEESLSRKRFLHSLGVEFTAASLAMRHDIPLINAQIAGLLHDCAKCLDDKKLLKICEKNQLSVSEVEKRNPYLLHGKVGAFLAKTDFEIDDEDILNAIAFHTTGRPGMSKLEKIIFIADFIEPGRNSAPNLTLIRKMAFEDIDQAMIQILGDTLEYLQSVEGEIDPMTKKTYDYYLKEQKEK